MMMTNSKRRSKVKQSEAESGRRRLANRIVALLTTGEAQLDTTQAATDSEGRAMTEDGGRQGCENDAGEYQGSKG